MAKRTADRRREWFDNCGGWRPRHDLDALRRGVGAGRLDEQDEYGMTALHLAVTSGWLAGVEELLRAGADTELRYHRTGETPLMTAAGDLGTGNGERLNSAAVVAALVAAGANPDAANHFGYTPRESARVRGSTAFDHLPARPADRPAPRPPAREVVAARRGRRVDVRSRRGGCVRRG